MARWNHEARKLVTVIQERGLQNVMDMIDGDLMLDQFFDGGMDLTAWTVVRNPLGIALVNMPWTIDEIAEKNRSLSTSHGLASTPRELVPDRYTDMIVIINTRPSRTKYYQEVADMHARETGRPAPLVLCAQPL